MIDRSRRLSLFLWLEGPQIDHLVHCSVSCCSDERAADCPIAMETSGCCGCYQVTSSLINARIDKWFSVDRESLSKQGSGL